MRGAHRRNLIALALFSVSCIPAASLLGIVAPIACGVFGALLLWAARAARLRQPAVRETADQA